MIFPILRGWLGPERAPVTWILIFMNLMMFSVTSRVGLSAQIELDQLTRDEFFVKTQGRVYARYLEDHPSFDSAVIPRLADEVNEGDLSRAETLGQLAFRDERFMNAVTDLTFDEDPVAFKIWRARFVRGLADQEAHPSFQLGVNAAHPALARWVTYIFVHSGAFHLFGNMLFLLIFGAALELQIGGLGVLMTFVGAGVVAAGAFATMTGFTGSPLVGASGAISGLMALYCALNGFKPARYFWFLLPWPGYVGVVWLPAAWALFLWGAADLAGYIATMPELGGVAHAAHLGGDAAGLAVGFALRLMPTRGRGPATGLASS